MAFSRDEDLKKVKEISFMPSTIETVDTAVFEWLNKDVDIFYDSREGFKKVPTIWLSAERAFQRKASARREIFTKEGVAEMPIITMERTGISKDPQKKGTAWANIYPVKDERGGSIVMARRIQQEKTSNFANADSKRRRGQVNFRYRKPNKKVVYETITIPQPVYIEASYQVTLLSIYQQHMNQMTTPFVTLTGNIAHFPIKRDGHLYEVTIDGNFSQENNSSNMAENERLYKTKINLKVLAYLLGEDQNQEGPKIVIRENAVEVKTPREKVIIGDPYQYLSKNGFNRE